LGGDPHGLVEQTVSGGYSSEHLLTTTRYTFSLCEKCLRNLFDSFKVPPAVDGSVSNYASYTEERKSYAWSRWRSDNGHLARVAKGLCNAEIDCTAPALWQVMHSNGLRPEVGCEVHRESGMYLGNYAVLFEIARKAAADPTGQAIADLWLRTSAWPAPALTFYRFVPECAWKACALEEDPQKPRHSALWVQNGCSVPAALIGPASRTVALPSGVLFIGLAKEMAALRGKENVRDVSIQNRFVQKKDDAEDAEAETTATESPASAGA
jgi:hypothetical protein